MNQTTVKITAVVIVAIIIVAAVAVVMMSGDDDDSTYEGQALPVYGNANEDDRIDSKDVEIIQSIIDGEDGYTLSAYPYADADYDGDVDSSDLSIVNRIINGESTTVYHLNYLNDGGTNVITYVASSKWPANGVITTYNSVMFITAILGCQDKVVGDTAVGSVWGDYYDYYLYSTIKENAISVDDSNLESVANCMDQTGTYTMLASGYTSSITNESDIEAMGCDVIRLCESVPLIDQTVSSILLAGFFLQEEEQAREVAEFYNYAWDATLEIADSIADGDKVKFAVGMASATNQHVYKAELAGGTFAFAGTTQDPGLYEGYTFGDWVYAYDVDIMLIVIWSNEYNGTFFGNDLDADYLLSSYSFYENTEFWQNGDVKFIYGDVPTALDPLVRGYAMYPELYGDLYEECMTTMLSFLGDEWSFDDLQFVYTLADIQAMASS